ncbi:MAG: hypothetical protein HOW73_42020 [Polyangiaceae bacterium]|nr:hypothetical protein [Polyangiaceae bacterium]
MKLRSRRTFAALAPLVIASACSPALIDPSISVGQAPSGTEAPTSPKRESTRASNRIASVSAGSEHLCAVSDVGKVYCWGRNQEHQLGDGTTEPRNTPTAVDGLGAVERVVAGESGTCAVTKGGELVCWGKVGERSLVRPTRIEGLTDVRTVAFDAAHACAVVGSGSVRCWGSNKLGQLGNGATDDVPTGATVAVQGVRDVADIVVIDSASCALTKQSEVFCWGAFRSFKSAIRTAPAAIAGLPKMKSINGSIMPCGVSMDGDVYCWGNHPKHLHEATKTDAWSNVAQYARGAPHACAITKDGKLQCGGRPQWGSMGIKPYVPSYPIEMLAPQEISAFGRLSKDARLVAGRVFTCVLDMGKLRCMGDNQYGQLGIGESGTLLDPFEIPNLEGVQRILPFTHRADTSEPSTCALKDDGRVACWGLGKSRNDPGIPGAERRTDAHKPRDVAGLSGVKGLFRGQSASEACVTKDNGGLWCFQAGLYAYPGSTTPEALAFAPRRMLGMKNVASTAPITDYDTRAPRGAYAVLSDGRVVAWRVKEKTERERDGELVADVEDKPISSLSNVSQLIATHDRACALYGDGTVGCFVVFPAFGTWKNANIDPRALKPEVVRIEGLANVAELSVSDRSGNWPKPTTTFVARTRDGSIFRWDIDSKSSTTSLTRMSATPVPGLGAATAMTHGGTLCIARKDGIDCERDRLGQYGPDGDLVPFHVDSGRVVTIEDAAHTCVVKADKHVACWGSNRGGAVGAPDRERSAEPLEVVLPE